MQARNVYPQLLLARLFFSLGGAATSTMVTAILPSMTAQIVSPPPFGPNPGLVHAIPPSVTSELTITPSRFRSNSQQAAVINSKEGSSASSPARLAGFVGIFTGCGALLALGVFLPLPARFQKAGFTPAQAIADSYYVVGTIALLVSLFCYIGLRSLRGEEGKGWKAIAEHTTSHHDVTQYGALSLSYWRLFVDSITLGFRNDQVGIAYLGGFVARASSVGISLFIPLYVNTYFVSSGLCKGDPTNGTEEMKRQCRRAYVLAAELTGVSQLVALLFAPVFGYASDRYQRYNIPILVAALIGIIGYLSFALLENPEPSGPHGGPAVFLIVSLLGISQIGAIVCSLGLLGHGVLGNEDSEYPKNGSHRRPTVERGEDDHGSEVRVSSSNDRPVQDFADETSGLLRPKPQAEVRSFNHMKGSMAGVYSLAGGAGILILTKLGGFLFDRVSTGAPFYMLAVFNGLLLLVSIACDIKRGITSHPGTK